MKFIEMIDLWTLQNPDKDFFDGIELHEAIDKESLLDYLLLEYMYLDTVDTSSRAFHLRVKNFFKIHKWNIDKLCESMLFEYKPLDNYHVNSTVETDRDKKVDTTTDRDQTSTSNKQSTNTGEESKTLKDTTDRNQDIDNTKNTITIGEESKTDTEKITSEKDWDETDHMTETDLNLVSAFNDIPSPEIISTDPIKYKYNDTEHDRQQIIADTTKEGTESITTNKNGHYDIDSSTTVSETGTESLTENITKNEHYDTDTKNDLTEELKGHVNEDIIKNEITDEGIVEDSYKYGNIGKSYQSLIEEERKQAQFNIYKWIARHFCRELLISLW